jgi:anti-sigma B factor antagonist
MSSDDIPTLVCRGRIISETASLLKSQVTSLAPDHKYILADLGDVDFIDSYGLGVVLAAFLSARAAGCEFKLIKVHPRVKDLLDMTRLASVLEDGVVL